ncbi:MAG TPA: RodZ domain-containing protein [Rhizomicrobium sp.]|nr:RodZ domain-containing protein [Rhizomicrobium sp.]
MTKVTRFTMDNGAGGEKRRLHLREISGEADAPLGTVGQDLRAARLRLGDDLATVSSTLKIRKDHLEALEEDRLEALPGRTYAIGFVRSYATYLGLDAAEYLERFKQEIAGRAEGAYLTPYIDPGERKLPQGWQLIAVAFAALLVFGAYLVVKAVSSESEPPVAPVPAEIANTAQAPAAPMQTQPLATPQPAATAPAIAAAPATAPAQASTAGTAETAQPKGKSYGLGNASSRIVLRVHKPVYITVKGEDNTVYISRMLQPGDTYRVPNLPGLILNAGDGSAVELVLDGASVGAVGSASKAAEGVSLDPQAVADRRNGAPAE